MGWLSTPVGEKRKSRVTRVVLVALCSTAIIALGWLVWELIRDHHLESAYQRLARHESKASVIAAFGNPESVRACAEYIPWNTEPTEADRNHGECIEEYWYFSHMSPVQWSVGFDNQGRALSKYRYVSP